MEYGDSKIMMEWMADYPIVSAMRYDNQMPNVFSLRDTQITRGWDKKFSNFPLWRRALMLLSPSMSHYWFRFNVLKLEVSFGNTEAVERPPQKLDRE
jgi:hypothetical protein